jgi:hypothetical protein
MSATIPDGTRHVFLFIYLPPESANYIRLTALG